MTHFVLRHASEYLTELSGDVAQVILSREAEAALSRGAGVELVRLCDGAVVARTALVPVAGGAERVGWRLVDGVVDETVEEAGTC